MRLCCEIHSELVVYTYIYIYRTSFRHLAPGTSSHHLPPGKGCLKVRCPCLSSRYWSYSLHAQFNSAVSYALFLLYRLPGVRTLATQTHQLLEVLHPGLLPQLQLHVVTKLRQANVCMCVCIFSHFPSGALHGIPHMYQFIKLQAPKLLRIWVRIRARSGQPARFH